MTWLELAASPTLLAAAVLLLGATASGINLYATLAALGLASRFGLIAPLPPGLTGLEHELVIATAGLLLVVEALADREPAFAGMWHSLHAVVKPTTAALLCGPALAGVEPLTVAIACLATGLVALVAHGIRYGARIAWRLPNAPRGASWLTAIEAVLAVAVLLPLRYRVAAVPTAAGVLLLLLAAGPAGTRAFSFGLSAQRARLRAFLGDNGWSRVSRMPSALAARIPSTPLAGTPPRATRVGVVRAPGFPRFRAGWLVLGPDAARIVGRGWTGRTRLLQLPAERSTELTPGTWTDLIRIDTDGTELRILLLKDGPTPALVMRALAPEPGPVGRVPIESPAP